jgi:hypothetical protein
LGFKNVAQTLVKSGKRPVAGCCQQGNEHSGIKKDERCHEALSHCLSAKVILLLAVTSQTKRILVKYIMVGPTEVIGGCRRLHNVQLRALYSSPNIIEVV